MRTLWISVPEAIVIVTGNVTVLVVFTRTPALRRRKHHLLVSLAVADLLVGVISVPMYVTISFVSLTKIYQFQDILFGTASVFGLAAVSIERAYAVYFPFKHRTLWKGVYIIGIAVIWIMAFLFATSEFFANKLTNILIISVLMISLVVVICSYTMICIRMNCTTPLSSNAIPRRDMKLTVTLLIITVISLFAWIPFLVINAMSIFYGPQILEGLENIIMVTKFCHYGNSLVNPIVYAFGMPDFKRALLMPLFCCNSFGKLVVAQRKIRGGNEASNDVYHDERRIGSHHGNNEVFDDKPRSHHGDKTKNNKNDKDCYENKSEPVRKGLHGNHFNLHCSDGTYRHTPTVNFPASYDNEVCRCSGSTNEIRALAVDNEEFIETYEETKL